MDTKKGYYSLIQFCPDASRLEAINVGIVLFCPELKFLKAKTTGNNRRAEQLVGRGTLRRGALDAAKLAIENRLSNNYDALGELSDLNQFIETRGNWLRLTTPRPLRVNDPLALLDSMYDELVGGSPLRRPKDAAKQIFPQLNDAFQRLSSQGRANIDIKVKVPIVGRSLSIPYAYQNGAYNLVKPQRFSEKDDPLNVAMRLAVEGDLIHKHGIEEKGRSFPAKLAIVWSVEQGSASDAVVRVNNLFQQSIQ